MLLFPALCHISEKIKILVDELMEGDVGMPDTDLCLEDGVDRPDLFDCLGEVVG